MGEQFTSSITYEVIVCGSMWHVVMGEQFIRSITCEVIVCGSMWHVIMGEQLTSSITYEVIVCVSMWHGGTIHSHTPFLPPINVKPLGIKYNSM